MPKPDSTTSTDTQPETPTSTLTLTHQIAAIRDALLSLRLTTTDEPTRGALWDAAAKTETAARRAKSAAKKGQA